MPQIYDMGPTALLPLRRKACWGFFFALNIRRLRPGLNPRTWVLKASTLSLDHRSRSKYLAKWKSLENPVRKYTKHFIYVCKVAKIRLLYLTCLSGWLSVRLSASKYSVHVEKFFFLRKLGLICFTETFRQKLNFGENRTKITGTLSGRLRRIQDAKIETRLKYYLHPTFTISLYLVLNE